MRHYQALGVEPDATYVQIRDAFRRLAQKNHPDKPDGDVEAYRRAAAAWEVLGDVTRRAAYDSGKNTTMSAEDQIEVAAKKGLMQIIDNIVDAFDGDKITQFDIKEGVYQAIENGENEIDKKLGELRALIKKLRRVYKRTTPKNSIFADRLKERRVTTIKAFKQVTMGVRIGRKMRELTDQFAYEFDPKPVNNHYGFVTISGVQYNDFTRS